MKKKGISLIVLVITIIVMIIIAGAVILSLNSSNVTGRANLSTLSSDRSNIKSEYAVSYANAMALLDTLQFDANNTDAFILAFGYPTAPEGIKSGSTILLNDKYYSVTTGLTRDEMITAAGVTKAQASLYMSEDQGIAWKVYLGDTEITKDNVATKRVDSTLNAKTLYAARTVNNVEWKVFSNGEVVCRVQSLKTYGLSNALIGANAKYNWIGVSTTAGASAVEPALETNLNTSI